MSFFRNCFMKKTVLKFYIGNIAGNCLFTKLLTILENKSSCFLACTDVTVNKFLIIHSCTHTITFLVWPLQQMQKNVE